VNVVGTSPLNFKMHLHLGAKDRYKLRICTWNVGTFTGRSIEKKENQYLLCAGYLVERGESKINRK